jgi:DHA1 family bicyclomycin/chloramphenicol resistance-like MFS transporter
MRRIPFWLPVLLGFLQAVGPVSTDMYLPAFPAIEASLHAVAGSAQTTLGTWVLGLALGQFMQGALADRFGRRAPLLAGTVIYTLGSIGCALSPSIAAMSGWRFFAALGASASMVIPRAIVRDISEGHAAARLMSRLILVLGAAPILAPSLGGLVLQVASWRGIFWINALYGALALLFAAWRLPDTLPADRRIEIHVAAMIARSAHILRERGFITHVLMMSSYTFALFAYLGGSPTTFIDHYHMSPGAYAVVFGTCAFAYIFCSQINVRVIRWLDLDGTLNKASSLYLALAAVLLVMAVSGAPALPFAAVLALTHSLNGFIAPNATVGALRHHGSQAGSASALMGTLQFTIGACGGFLVGVLTDGTGLPMVGLMFCGAVAGKLFDRLRPSAVRG